MIDWEIKALSNNDIESRTEPSEVLAISFIAASDIFPFSRSAIFLRCSQSCSTPTLLRSNLWHLDKIVTGIFLTSVVASINFKLGGGSSKVLSNPLNACFESMCTSSIINILNFALVGLYFEFSINSLTSSIPVLDAASISKISI